ncbi:MAG: LysR family transcriptional regulator [Sphingomonas sp.]|nr:LysR family transcriptional regulator [Sphingomonas sp.]
MRQLEALDMIAREGSFRAAARALGISQVAVSDHIRQLEARLGTRLFDRSRGGKARLSSAGEAALSRARLILSDCDALVATMRDFAGAKADVDAASAQENRTAPVTLAAPLSVPEDEPAAVQSIQMTPEPLVETAGPEEMDRPIVIGTHPSILSRFQEKIAAFEDAFPHRPVSIDFNCFVADRVALALSSDKVSIAYFYALGETKVFPSDYLWSERWALFVGEGHRLAGAEFVGREDLAGEALVGFTPGNRLRPLLDACLAEAGLGGLPFALASDDYPELVDQARRGAGILPLFGAAAARIGTTAGLKRLPYVDPIPAIDVRRVVHPSLESDDEVQALIATLQ